jgi:hypothetical protein
MRRCQPLTHKMLFPCADVSPSHAPHTKDAPPPSPWQAGYTPLTLDVEEGMGLGSIVRKTTVLDVMRRLLQVGRGVCVWGSIQGRAGQGRRYTRASATGGVAVQVELLLCACSLPTPHPPPTHPPTHPHVQPKNLMVSNNSRTRDYDKSKYISILNIIQVRVDG